MMKQFSYRHTKEAELMDSMEQAAKGAPQTDEELFSFAGFNEAEVERTGYSNYSYWSSTFRAFLKNKGAVVLLVLLLLLLAFTFIQPHLPGQYDPNMIVNDETGMQYRNIPPGDQFILGTNSIGQDLWARIWAGTRTSLLIGLSVALAEALIGITVGVIWGYVRKADFILTEIYNIIDSDFLYFEAGCEDTDLRHVPYGMDSDGAFHQKPDSDYPRQGLQCGQPLSRHADGEDYHKKPASLSGVGYYAAYGADDSVRHWK